MKAVLLVGARYEGAGTATAELVGARQLSMKEGDANDNIRWIITSDISAVAE